MHLLFAVRCFFAVLFSAETARRIESALAEAPPSSAEPPRPPVETPKAPAGPVRSEAVSLLAALQREARFVDFVMEPLTGYSDAQVGAAARGVHDECAAVLGRMFAPQPVRTENEGEPFDVESGYEAGELRIVGDRPEGSFRATLQHPGWRATRCDVPRWTGGAAAVDVIAAAEAEVVAS